MSNFQISGLKVFRRLNILRRKCKRRKNKQKQDTCISSEYFVDKEIQNLLESFTRRCISQDFISEMKEAFFLFDKDRSGYICSKELGSLLRTLGYNPTQDEVNNLMALVDVDHNGKIDLVKFILMMHDTIGKTDTMEEIRMAFRAFDTDGDGKISKEEFRICMLNFGERFGDDEINDMVKEADNDKDGSIDFDEFVKMIIDEYPITDTHRKLVKAAGKSRN